MKRKKYSPSEVYRALNSNLVSCWITAYLMSMVFLGSLTSIVLHGLGYNALPLIFSVLVLIQALRGIFKLRTLKRRLQENPGSVRMPDVFSAPSFKGIYPFVRWQSKC